MTYFYKGELAHQILFYSYTYPWSQARTSAESFALDFIADELAISKEHIPSSILQTVIRSIVKVMPPEKFSI